MTNNTIILNEVFNNFPTEQRAELASRIYTADKIAALAARMEFDDPEITEEEKIDHAAAYIVASNLHTFNEWKRSGLNVKPGEHAALVCYLWQWSDKPRKAAQALKEAAANDSPAEDAEEGSGYFYKTKSHLFGAWQVESNAEREQRQAAAVKFKSREELIAYNKKLAAERKAAKAAAQKPAAPVQSEQPAEVVAIIPAAAQPAQNTAQLDFASIAAGLIG